MTRGVLTNFGPDATTLWSRRWSVARGWHACSERQCAPETVEGWLAYFRKQEPSVEFVASVRPPRGWDKPPGIAS